MRSEDSALNDAIHLFGEQPAKLVKHAFGLVRGRRSDERGAISFLGAGVQGKLADRKQLATNLLHRSIHCRVFVREYP